MSKSTETSLAIIAAVGSAKGFFVEAIRNAELNDIAGAKKSYEAGVDVYNKGHKAHMDLVTQFANGEEIGLDILLVHAECQMMSAEDFKVISSEVIDYAESRTKA